MGIDNKRGSIIDMIIFIVVALIVVAFFGMYAYGFNLVNGVLEDVDVQVGSFNFTETSQDTFGRINTAQLNWLPIIAMFMILGSGLFIFISNSLVRVNPVFIVPYIIVLIIAISISVYISNVYEEVFLNGIATSIYTEWTAVNYLMVNLPYVLAIFGIFGLVFLFTTMRNEGGEIV